MSRRTWLLFLAILAVVAGIELAMGRNPICTCGNVALWVGERDSPRTSQMLADWYSLSHIVHGLLFYVLLWLVARRLDANWRFVIASCVEAAWEVVENTPMVIDRYRATTAALGYTGDSVVNSLSDVVMMAIGFLIARKMPVRTSILLLILLEVVPLRVIRDNLTLNVIALVAPNPAIQAWQAGG
ncbi:MAG: DUF2585 family protein [Sphingomonas sp.]|nr:DUF2585 family protein [Sphingomonas sp.]